MQAYTYRIANGGTASSPQNPSTATNHAGKSIVKIAFPTMTSTSVTLQNSSDNSTFKTIGDKDGAITISTPSTRSVHLAIPGIEYLKIIAGSAEGADRDIVVFLEDFTS